MVASTAVPGISGPADTDEGARHCAACPHPWSDHDDLGARFCAATAVSHLTRGCVCGPAAPAGGAN